MLRGRQSVMTLRYAVRSVPLKAKDCSPAPIRPQADADSLSMWGSDRSREREDGAPSQAASLEPIRLVPNGECARSATSRA